MGLARNSLYRYFPDEPSILLRWYRNEMPALAERSAELLDGDSSPAHRIERWAAAQIDDACRPEQHLIAALGQAAEHLDDDDRAELADSHRQVLAPFHATLADAALRGAEAAATADLIWNAILAQARRELHTGDDPAGRAVLDRCIEGLVF